MRINKFIVFLVLILNFLIGQAEYQILTTPQSIFQLSTNGASLAINNLGNYTNPAALNIADSKYGFSLINYPDNIKMYNVSYKNFHLSVLDYGQLIDGIDDTINKTFTAQEILFQYYYKYEIRNLKFGISSGLLNSKIYTENSTGGIISLGMNAYYEKINSSIGLSVENLGYVFKSYTAYNLSFPIEYRFSFNHQRKSFIIGYDLLYTKEIKEFKHILCLEFHINKRIKLRASNSSYLSDLLIDSNDYNFISGLGMGMEVRLESINFNIGFMNLGSGGAAYGISIDYLKN